MIDLKWVNLLEKQQQVTDFIILLFLLVLLLDRILLFLLISIGVRNQFFLRGRNRFFERERIRCFLRELIRYKYHILLWVHIRSSIQSLLSLRRFFLQELIRILQLFFQWEWFGIWIPLCNFGILGKVIKKFLSRNYIRVIKLIISKPMNCIQVIINILIRYIQQQWYRVIGILLGIGRQAADRKQESSISSSWFRRGQWQKIRSCYIFFNRLRICLQWWKWTLF